MDTMPLLLDALSRLSTQGQAAVAAALLVALNGAAMWLSGGSRWKRGTRPGRLVRKAG